MHPHGYALLALVNDVANAATVSLIDSITGQTMAAALTSATGVFRLSPATGFSPVAGRPYVIEAIKGLGLGGAFNSAGAPVVRLRTLLFFADAAWQTGNWTTLATATPGAGIPLGRATTALSVIASLRVLSGTDQAALVGKLAGGNFVATGTAVSQAEYSQVYNLVAAALSADLDPVEAVSFDPTGASPAAQYGNKVGNMVVHGTTSPAIALPGGTITLSGQNFPASGLNITLAGTPVPYTLNAARTQLTATLPGSAYSGWVTFSSGRGTWLGPFAKVSGTVGTLAGNGGNSFRAGPGPLAQFANMRGIAVSADGTIYLAETVQSKILSVTPAGMVLTFAGSGIDGYADGTGSAAQFFAPQDLAVDTAGRLYLADQDNARIRMITSSGVVTTIAGNGAQGFADGSGTAAQFNKPVGMAVDGAYNLYVGDLYNHRVRKITAATGAVSTLAGSGTAGYADGSGTAAQFNLPQGVTVDALGDLYLADAGNNRIRKITAGGVVSTLAGSGAAGFADGSGVSAQFNNPTGVALDSAGNVYVADTYNHRIRKITPGGSVTTLIGDGTPDFRDGTAARVNSPYMVDVDALGRVYVLDRLNYRVRLLVP